LFTAVLRVTGAGLQRLAVPDRADLPGADATTPLPRVDVVPAYRTVRAETHDRARVEALLVGGAVDCVTFTSASTVINFAQLFETGDLRGLLDGVAVACIGEITAHTAAGYGLRTHVRPAESTVSALALAIAKHFRQTP
jgi:uroporphyrinogen III methyltransferase/synthase